MIAEEPIIDPQSGVVATNTDETQKPEPPKDDSKGQAKTDKKPDGKAKGTDQVDIAGLMSTMADNFAKQMKPLVETTIKEYLASIGIAPDKVSAKQNVFENPPVPPEMAGTPDDGYERIIVGVTQADIEMGKNKLHEMQALGWEIDKTLVENARYIMKAPREHVRKIRAAAEQLHRQWTKPRTIEVGPEIKAQGGSNVKNAEAPTADSYTTQEIAEMAATGVVPISPSDD